MDSRLKDRLVITRTTPEWCAVDTGGVFIFLFLTSLHTDWCDELSDALREAASRSHSGRVPVLSVFRLDKRYPFDVGFDANLPELGAKLASIAPLIEASSVVLDFNGLLAFTWKAALRNLNTLVGATYPARFHSSLVSGVRWLRGHVPASRVASVRHYVDAVEQMKDSLGCDATPIPKRATRR